MATHRHPRAILAAMLALAPGVAAPASSVVAVTGGLVRGVVGPSMGAAFKGIPYAQPPVGDLRWREPRPLTPWKGERDASSYAPACMQNPLGTGRFLQPLARLYGASYNPGKIDQSEDCLYLNVWTPEWPAKTPAAVMVWFHGGSNLVGSGAEKSYDGTALARKGVVVVTINYRLGALGFFAHAQLTAESGHSASGNYGLLDQVAALQWVRRNISQFGGDPDRVTVFGESAGAIDAGLLLCSPLAAGLFRRVIMESGPVLSMAPLPAAREVGERYGEKVALALGVGGADAVRKLRALPPERILQTAADAAKRERYPDIVLDGWFLPAAPAEVFAQGKQMPVDLMIGNNGREMSAFRTGADSRPPSGGDDTMKIVRLFYGGSTPVVGGMYLLNNALGRTEAADSWLNDVLAACPAMATAALHSSTGGRAYVYQFLRAIPGQGMKALGSFHGLELPYVFDTFRRPSWSWLPFQPVDFELGESIREYWTNFAKTGDPNESGLPRWKVFSTQSRNSMEFTERGSVAPRSDARPSFCDLDVPSVKRRLHDAAAGRRARL